MKIQINFENGKQKTITYTGTKTFPQWFQHFSSARYYILDDSNEVGNMAIDVQKVVFIELV